MRVKIESDLDGLIKILENPIRRRVIERLSQEGQQLVTKHLKIMERSGLIDSTVENSPLGAQRRVFGLTKSFSIIIDVAPHLFKQSIVSFEVTPEEYQISGTASSLLERRDRILDYPNEKDKMKPFSMVLAEIDGKLEILEQERAVLLSIRNSIMMEASKIIENIEDIDSRRVLHSALGEHDTSVKRIAETLNLREDRVKKIIQKLKNELNIEYFK